MSMKKHQDRGFLIKWIILFVDLMIINGVFFLVYYTIEHLDARFFVREIRHMLLPLNLCYFISVYFVPIKIYFPVLHIDKVIQRAFSTVSLHAILVITCLFFLYKSDFPAQFILTYYLSLYLAFAIWRISARKILTQYRKAGYNYKRVIIVGAGKNGRELYEDIKMELASGFRVLGFFDDNESFRDKLGNLYLGKIDEIEQFVVENDVVNVYCALPDSQSKKTVHILNFCEKNMIRFYLVPEYSIYIKKSLIFEPIGSVPVLAIRPEPLQYHYNRLIKRTLDIVFSLFVILIFFPPLYLILGTLIKLSSPGHIHFKQMRTGIYGKDFVCYKFRSMRQNDEADTKQAEKNDSRLTKVGAFIRKTNIDEMPQFFNVLKGEMSIVGPRPHMLNHTKLYSSLVDKYMVRHLVKPGITGWAQITGFRGEINNISQMEERVKRDVWYIENWTFLMDLKIIALTAMSMFKRERENAY